MIIRKSILLGILFITLETVYIDDSIHHAIIYHSIAEAPNAEELLQLYDSPTKDYMAIRSANDERYVCQLPESAEEKVAPTAVYTGPSPAELLAPLANNKECTLRQDSYWWYQLCHGRYILQFHEDKNTKKRMEFYLGNFKQDYISLGTSKIEQMNPPKRFFDNEERAYYNVSFTQGTHCELINGPRTANVLYVCSEEHNHLFHSYMEISSCKYEIVVLTNRLCSHPAYKVKPKKNRQIHCYNVDEEAPAKPMAVEEMDKSHENTFKNEYVIKISDGETEILREVVHEMLREIIDEPSYPAQVMKLVGEKRMGWNIPHPFPSASILKETVDLILTGKECIEADQGWWNFEICYGKTIKQVHYENGRRITEHLLGGFDLVVHKAWVNQSPLTRKPKEYNDQIMQVSHLYSKGDICPEIKAHRSVELRIRCKYPQPVMGTVTLAIEEPSLCQYIINLESDRFCEPMQYADQYGIIAMEPKDMGPSVVTDPPPSEDSSFSESTKEDFQKPEAMPLH